MPFGLRDFQGAIQPENDLLCLIEQQHTLESMISFLFFLYTTFRGFFLYVVNITDWSSQLVLKYSQRKYREFISP